MRDQNSEDRYFIVPYQDDCAEAWDKFVETDCINGTFLQTRRFLGYHPSDRFEDASYLVYDKKDHLVAVCPACAIYENDVKVLFSHKGSTYGGVLFCAKVYHVEEIIDILECLEKKLKEDGYEKIVFKITPSLLSKESSELFQFILGYKEYRLYNELNLLIDFDVYKEDILSNFSQGKRTNVHNCEKEGCILKEINDRNEIAQGYDILCKNLEKYGLKPVHTLNELLDLRERLAGEIGFFGIYLNNKVIAFSAMFYFNQVGVAHSQYLGALQEYNTLSPMTYLYYCMIKEMRERGFKKLSWGITTEHLGVAINMGLTKSKEAFGSKYSLNQIYEKYLD